MDPNYFSQWISPQQQTQILTEPSQQSLHESRPTSSLEDWSKERTASTGTSTSTPTVTTTSTAPTTAALDFADIMGDIATTGSSSALSPQSTAFYQSFQNYFQAPFNSIPYGAAWNSQSTVPLSNYSSLNGATSAGPSSSPTSQPATQPQPQPQPQHQAAPQHSPPLQAQSPPQPMIIDPALTTLNGAATNGLQQYSQPSSFQPQQSRTSYPFTHLSLSLSNSNPYLYSHSYPQQIATASAQGTLSPQALHSPSQLMTTIVPSQFYGKPQPSGPQSAPPAAPPPAPSQPPGSTPQERKQQFLTSIRPLLQASAFTGAQAVNTLASRISVYGPQDVDAATRLEILTKIRDGAGNHYFRAWSENPTAMDISREWLKSVLATKEDSTLVETIMPLLHIVDRLPLNIDALKTYKLGKLIVKLSKDPPSPAIKDMASNIERRWRQIVEVANDTKSEEPKTKKRKLEAPVSKPSAAPVKKPTVTLAPTKTVTKKVTAPAAKDAKSDSSFFSAPKPKPKLPTFKKAPVVKKEPDANVSQPLSIDPFQEALKSMAKSRKESPAPTPTPPTATTSSPPQAAVPGPSRLGRKKKSVSWAPDSDLESIRFIEKAVYDDDPVDVSNSLFNLTGMHTAHSARELEKGEGAALHQHVFEETIDWSEPQLIDIPIDIEIRPRGDASEEKATQEQREETALGAMYMTPAHIPPSPGEPTNQIPDEEVDRDVQTMTSGPDVEAVFWNNADPAPSNLGVADLVAQLAGAMETPPFGVNGNGDINVPPVDASTASALSTMPPEQLQQLLQQLNPTLFGNGNANQIPFGGGDQNWTQQPGGFTEYGHGLQDDTSEGAGHWRGGGRGARGIGRARGRGRGGRTDDGGYRHNKRKPCSFFQAGRRALNQHMSKLGTETDRSVNRCKYGDQCDFAHEYVS
ncbi:uncharacterized protein BT62DRAFT_1006200 [Guyanagaster necrorhizus]|uniref:Serine/threonine-protein phosphatase 1 regulatory subunit 10 n=1 Tax=Guyanagaster necrorhizus TaxID=856835 RepID=A0A9P7VRC1_9AGAR|nr:uncharacterized protein BT62DRAFT_1006200 [Guyanagaster necrorhizus MCA 3950]KAG7446023.1 hypothetical protein BT62DRAFT_1006200 [Guyanagaster necrorhizus MCA 3950]